MLNLEQIKEMFKIHNYRFFDKGDYNVNFFAIRNNNLLDDKFGCDFYLVYKQGIDGWKVKTWKGTTKPGIYYSKKLLNTKGVAILKPQQYKYKLGLHKGKEALVPATSFNIWRDKNGNGVIDKVIEDNGWFGTNFHRAGIDSKLIGKYSAGCMVIDKEKHFLEMMSIIKRSLKMYGETITFTIFEK